MFKSKLLDAFRNGKDSETRQAEEVEAELFYSWLNENRSLDILGSGELIMTTLKKSTSKQRAKRGDLVTITLTAKLESGVEVQHCENLELHLGDCEVVPGLDIAIPFMYVGEEAELVVDAEFAYRELGLTNEQEPAKDIPPNATLTYHLSLLDAKHENSDDLKTLHIRYKHGMRKKERANFWFKRQEYSIAIQLYKRALEYLDGNARCQLSWADYYTLLAEGLVVYNNLAMAQIKDYQFEEALQSINKVLRHQPNNSKALYRKGLIFEAKKEMKGAITFYQKAAALEPDNKSINMHLSELVLEAKFEGIMEEEDVGAGKLKMLGLLLCTIFFLLSLHRLHRNGFLLNRLMFKR